MAVVRDDIGTLFGGPFTPLGDVLKEFDRLGGHFSREGEQGETAGGVETCNRTQGSLRILGAWQAADPSQRNLGKGVYLLEGLTVLCGYPLADTRRPCRTHAK